MKNIYLKAALVFVLSGLTGITSAQTFQQAYGGSNNDSGHDFEFTSDGGFIIVGQTLSSGAGWNDVYLVKTNASGVKEWEKTIGGIGDDYAYHIVKAHDGGFVIAGSTKSSGAGSDDFYLVKIDESGNKIWEKTYGTSGIDIGREVQTTSDGGYIIIGYTQSNNYDMMVVKTTANGTEEWRKTYGGGQFENGYSVKEASDGYVLLGTTYSYGNGAGDAWVVKITPTGTMEWNFPFGGVSEEEGQYIETTTDGGYLLAYDAMSNSMGDYDIGITKINSSGGEEWTKLYGDTEKDVAKMVKKTAGGGYIISGITRSFGLVNPDFWLIRTDAAGNEIWKKNYGGINHEHCYAAKETSNGDFVATGHTQSTGSGMDDVWLIRVNSQGVLDVTESENINLISVYPNPAVVNVTINSSENIKDCNVKILSVTGQKIYSENFSNLANQSINIANMSKGIYFLQVSSDRGEQTTKLLID